MDKEKYIMKMVNYYLKVNIEVILDGMVKDMMKKEIYCMN